MGETEANYALCIDVTTITGVFGSLAYSFKVLDCLRLVGPVRSLLFFRLTNHLGPNQFFQINKTVEHGLVGQVERLERVAT